MDKKLVDKNFNWKIKNIKEGDIKFIANRKISSNLGDGSYGHIKDNTYQVLIGDSRHHLTFNSDYTKFDSVRQGTKVEIGSGSIK
jgi:hypothetical protein